MVQREKPERKIEKLVLLIFSIYNISILSISVSRKWEIWVSACIFASLVFSWIVYAGRYKDFHFRAGFVTVMMQVSICLCAINVKTMYEVLPFFATFVVLTGLYGIAEVASMFYISILFLFFYHSVVLHHIFSTSASEVIHMVLQLINMLFLIFLVRFWMKKRAATNVEFIKTIEELKEAERSKTDFLANVSHEIRTPINTICGMSEVVLQEENFEKVREDVHYIQMAGRNLMSVVSDILDFSELQLGRLEMEEEAYNITSTVNDIINMTLARMKDKKIELIVDCDATIPCSLLGDEKKIRRVIMNLLDNAVKFTEDGCVSLHVTYRKEEYGINLIVTVKDTGIGIKEESLEKLFYSFSQVDTRRNRQKGGIGLGLAISKAIIQMLGGVITVKSKFGKGTIVKCVVPQKVLDERPIASLKNKDELNIGIYVDMEQFRMMEIRDEYSNLIRHMLEQMQVRGHICRNLSELKRRDAYEKFTHIFISIEEYKEEPAYFDELALSVKVVVILFRDDEKLLSNPNLLRMYKPFYIIPIVLLLNEDQTERNDSFMNKKAKIIAPQAHILVVDDNLMNLKVMEGVLEKYKIKVSTATGGRDALEKMDHTTYDLVFMDHMMPEMDGVETLHQIRSKAGIYFKTVPVIALTANAIAGAREMFLSEGFTDFLEKPVEMSVLQRVLMRNLPKKKQYFVEEEEEQTTTQEEKREVEKMEHTEKEHLLEKENNVQNEQEFSIGDLDVQKGMLYCDGKEKYLEILKLYRDTVNENRMQVEELFKNEDWKQYTIMVHGIKSSMLSIGATALSELAKKLEMAGKEDNITYIRENHGIMMKEYERVAKILQEHPLVRKKEEHQTVEQDLPVLADAEFENWRNELENAMYALDEERMLEILAELQKYQYYGIALCKPVEIIIRKVKMADYMSAVEALSKLQEKMQRKGKGDE